MAGLEKRMSAWLAGALFVLPAVLFIVVAAYLWLDLARDPSTLPSALIDRAVPEFVLPPLYDDEREFSSANLRGAVSLVNMFASWCGPCRVEHPVITRLARKEGIVVYGINVRDRPEEAQAWLGQLGNPYRRIGVDRNGRVSIDWGVYGLPETFVVDRDGRIRYRHVGPISERDLTEKILPMLRMLADGPASGKP
jgi:cytochrome c biogenesis protein CcmG/thiol:disulfide interchange protein DsbE